MTTRAKKPTTAHTAGPWHVTHENSGDGLTFKDAKGRHIGHSCAVRSRDGKRLDTAEHVEREEAMANGRLMCAAPDGLAAALLAEPALAEGFENCGEDPDCIWAAPLAAVRAFIAKAQGAR
ncbi:MAG: hypothetical protein KA310_03210 [Pseudomonadales bacterium]|nr:hypothetical protein [Pseudomonadales bacterium]